MRRDDLDMVTRRSTHGRGRHVRPGRRRLPPLLGRRALARSALREDAVRQRAARPCVPARMAADGARPLPRDRRGNGRVLVPRAALPDGGFASSQDADTDGVEGLTYTWTADEVGPDIAPLLEPFEHGRSIVRGELPAEARARLLAIRAERPQPGRDDKAIASWNGLALAALAEAGRRLDRTDWLAAARTLADFLLGPLSSGVRLHRSYRAGRASGTGYLDDYANVAHGLYELHVATGDLRYLEEARRLALLAVELFADDDRGGFFMTPSDGEQLVARTKDLDDSPIPSGNSMLAHVLQRLARIYGDDELEHRAVSVLRLVGRRSRAAPRSSPGRSARSTCTSRPRARSRSSAGRRTRSRAPHSPGSSRTPSSLSGPPKTCPCSKARRQSTASRRSTSASASPVRRLSRIRRRFVRSDGAARTRARRPPEAGRRGRAGAARGGSPARP